MVLVVGSTGKLGRAIVRRLRMDGVVVRALVRPASDVAVLRDSGAELVVGDLRNAESLRRACQGCDAVVTTASSLHTSTGFDPKWTDRNGNLNLIQFKVIPVPASSPRFIAPRVASASTSSTSIPTPRTNKVRRRSR